MTEPKDLLLVNEQLRRSNRRWKTLALAACSALVLAVLALSLATASERVRSEHARREAEAALANALRAANPGQAR